MSAGQAQAAAVAPQTGAAVNGKARHQRSADEFFARHLDEKGKRRTFSATFNTLLEAMTSDDSKPAELRFAFWLIRQAWGNYSDLAVDARTGASLTQRDSAAKLGLHETRISHVAADFRLRGFLKSDTGQELHLEDDPAIFAFCSKKLADSSKLSDPGDSQSPYERFVAGWRLSHPTEAEQLDQARIVVDRINHQILADYRASQRSKNGDDPSPAENLRTPANFEPTACPLPKTSVADSSELSMPTPSSSQTPLLKRDKGEESSSSGFPSTAQNQTPETSTTTKNPSQSQPAGTVLVPELELPPPMAEADFKISLRGLFANADKPLPTASQCAEVAAILPPEAYAPYLVDLGPRILRWNHPGALRGDAAAFAEAWPEKCEALTRQRRAEWEAARRQELLDREAALREQTSRFQIAEATKQFEALPAQEKTRRRRLKKRELSAASHGHVIDYMTIDSLKAELDRLIIAEMARKNDDAKRT